MRTPAAAALPSSVSGLTRRPAAASAPGPQPRAAPRPNDDPTRDLLARLPAGDARRRIIEALDQQGVLALAAKLFGAAAGPSLRPVKPAAKAISPTRRKRIVGSVRRVGSV